jgi:predicted TIM-barrel fold metal-dependent hydrolase
MLVSRLGAERVVFNSGEPRSSHKPCLATVESADIDDEARELILAGNARRIFGERR